MNILEGVSGNYDIDKDKVIACSSSEDERNNVVTCKFKFYSNIIIKLKIERTFLYRYNSGDRLQVILGKLNEKYYELKPTFTPDPNAQKILENARDIFGTAPKPFFQEMKREVDSQRENKLRTTLQKDKTWRKNEEEQVDESAMARFEEILNDE